MPPETGITGSRGGPALGLALALLAAGCATQGPNLAPVDLVPAPAVAVDTATWSRRSTGHFSLLLPPGWTLERLPHADSVEWIAAGEGTVVDLIWGRAAVRPPEWWDLGQTVTQTQVQGYPAILTVPGRSDIRGLTALYVEGLPGGRRFSAVAENVAASRRPMLEALYRSIRFDAGR